MSLSTHDFITDVPVFRSVAQMGHAVDQMGTGFADMFNVRDDFAAHKQTSYFDGLNKPEAGAGLMNTDFFGSSVSSDFADFDNTCAAWKPSIETAICIRRIKPTPDFFFKESSFISHSEPLKILADLCDAFDACSEVDHDFITAKNKIRGVVRTKMNGSAKFVVKVYEHGDECLVEFHCTGGCKVSFNLFYRNMLERISTHFIRRATSPTDVRETVDCLSAPKCSRLPAGGIGENNLDSLDITSLFEMLQANCSSHKLDLQRQGLNAFAECLSGQHSEHTQHNEKVIQVLKDALPSQEDEDGVVRDDQVVDNACFVLLQLCSSEHSRKDVVQKLLSQVLLVLESSVSLESWSRKRNLAKALSILSSKPEHANLITDDCVDELKHYQNRKEYSDKYFQQHLSSTLTQIQSYRSPLQCS